MINARALITGASSGIGLELARQFAKHGHPLVITAPDKSELTTIAAQLESEYGVDVRMTAKDLVQPSAIGEMFSELEQDGSPIHILVNNAGLGQRGKFWEIPLDRDVEMIRLNVEAVIRLTKLFLPPMVQRGSGRILNTASIAGFEPGPLLAVYHATKAFVLSFSESLATELQGTGITVTALCPGPVDTDFFPKAEMIGTRAFQEANVMAPQDVAAAAYDALMNGDRVYIPGGLNKIMAFSRRLIPESTQAKMNEKLYGEVPVNDIKRGRGDIEAEAAQKAARDQEE